MLTVYVKPSSIWIYPYKLGQLPDLEKQFIVWEKIYRKKKDGETKIIWHPKTYLYDFDEDPGEEYGTLRLPRGFGVKDIIDAIDVSGIRHEVIDCSDDYPIPRKIQVHMQLYPRDDEQKAAINFLDNCRERQSFLTLDVGKGKTFVASTHISHLGYAAMVISYNLSAQWQKRLIQYTDLECGSDIRVIAGSLYLKEVLDDKHKDEKLPSIFLVSLTTLNEFAKTYGKAALQEVALKLGIGIKIFDEAHSRYLQFNMVDMNMQTAKTLYLTATPGRSDRGEDRMYNRIYMYVPQYGTYAAQVNQFYTIRYLNYDTRATADDKRKFRNTRGFQTLKYSRYLFDKCGAALVRSIMRYVDALFKEDRHAKVLIVTDWLKDIQFMKDYIRQNRSYSVGTYCNIVKDKEEREQQLDCMIIIGTVGSMQNGKDIPGLRALFALTQFSSKIIAQQLLGRLREIEGKNVYYFDFLDESVEDIGRFRYHRNEVFQERAIGDIKTTFIDLTRA